MDKILEKSEKKKKKITIRVKKKNKTVKEDEKRKKKITIRVKKKNKTVKEDEKKNEKKKIKITLKKRIKENTKILKDLVENEYKSISDNLKEITNDEKKKNFKTRKINKKKIVIKKKEFECIKKCKKKLRLLQKRVIRFMNNNPGLLVVHGTGCGKTIAAVVASQCFLEKYPMKKVIFVAPASLLTNFRDELIKEGIKNIRNYELYSYHKFLSLRKRKRGVDCKDKMLILDEAHNIRSRLSKKNRNKMNIVKSILECSYRAEKRLLLTATPFVNSAQDFINLINIVYGKEICGTKNMKKMNKKIKYVINKKFDESTIKILKELLTNKIDFVSSCANEKEFPNLKTQYLTIKMTEEYKKIYMNEIRNVNKDEEGESFYNKSRRAVNAAGLGKYLSKKIIAALKIIKESIKKNKRILIYTNWIGSGTEVIGEILKENKIKFNIFNGQTKNKDEIVREFNDGKFPVLVITKSGGEGLDLKKIRTIIIMDPVWNQANLDQIIGRAVRYKSHEGLKESEREVNVYKMVLSYPEGNEWYDMDPIMNKDTGDQILYKIIRRKNNVEKDLYKLIGQISIDKFNN